MYFIKSKEDILTESHRKQIIMDSLIFEQCSLKCKDRTCMSLRVRLTVSYFVWERDWEMNCILGTDAHDPDPQTLVLASWGLSFRHPPIRICEVYFCWPVEAIMCQAPDPYEPEPLRIVTSNTNPQSPTNEALRTVGWWMPKVQLAVIWCHT